VAAVAKGQSLAASLRPSASRRGCEGLFSTTSVRRGLVLNATSLLNIRVESRMHLDSRISAGNCHQKTGGPQTYLYSRRVGGLRFQFIGPKMARLRLPPVPRREVYAKRSIITLSRAAWHIDAGGVCYFSYMG